MDSGGSQRRHEIRCRSEAARQPRCRDEWNLWHKVPLKGYPRITQSRIIILTYPWLYKSDHLIPTYPRICKSTHLFQLIPGYPNLHFLYRDIQYPWLSLLAQGVVFSDGPASPRCRMWFSEFESETSEKSGKCCGLMSLFTGRLRTFFRTWSLKVGLSLGYSSSSQSIPSLPCPTRPLARSITYLQHCSWVA